MLVDYTLGFHFRKNSSGQLVFLPLISKGKAYFVESQADEEKLCAFVGMYRGANLLLTLLCYLAILAPTSLGYNLFAGAIPMHTKLMTAMGNGLFWLLCFGASAWMLWGSYKRGISKFTYAMTEVPSNAKGQIANASPGARRAALLCLFAGIVVLGIGLLIALQYSHR